MSFSLVCFVVAAVLFFLLGFSIVEESETSSIDLDRVGFFFIALGLALGGVSFPSFVIGKRE